MIFIVLKPSNVTIQSKANPTHKKPAKCILKKYVPHHFVFESLTYFFRRLFRPCVMTFVRFTINIVCFPRLGQLTI